LKAFITGVGWVTPSGMGCGRDHNNFEMKPDKLPEITRSAVFDAPYPHFGRLDRYSRLGVAAIGFALKDAGLDRWTRKRPVGIIASTVHGCLETDLNYYDTVIPDNGRLASPNLFAYTLPNSYLGEAAIRFGLTGTCYAINSSTFSSPRCLRMALINIAGGQCDKVIGGVCDTGRLPPFSVGSEDHRGAIFFVIEKTIKRARMAYGGLHLSNDGILALNGEKVRSLPALAQKCIHNKSSGNKKTGADEG